MDACLFKHDNDNNRSQTNNVTNESNAKLSIAKPPETLSHRIEVLNHNHVTDIFYLENMPPKCDENVFSISQFRYMGKCNTSYDCDGNQIDRRIWTHDDVQTICNVLNSNHEITNIEEQNAKCELTHVILWIHQQLLKYNNPIILFTTYHTFHI